MDHRNGKLDLGRRLAQRLRPVTVLIGILVSLAFPVASYLLSLDNLRRDAEGLAREVGRDLEPLLLDTQQLWKYQLPRYRRIVQNFLVHDKVALIRVLDERAQSVPEYEYAPPAPGCWWNVRTVVGSTPIMFNNRQVGTIQVGLCQEPVSRGTAVILILSATVGIALARLAYRFPLRVVGEMEGQIGKLVDTVQRAREESENSRVAAETSERRLRALVQGLNAIVWEADAETRRFSFVSDQAEAILGYAAAQWLRDPDFWSKRIHPGDREGTLVLASSAIREGGDFELEYRAIRADGGEVWLRDLVQVVADAEGRPRVLRGVTLDVTERRRADERLRVAAHALESLGEIVTVTDPEDRFTYVNQAFLRIYGYTQEEVLGRHVSLVRSPDNPPGLAREILDHTRAGGWKGEVLNRTKDGREILIGLSTSQIHDGAGKLLGLVGIGRDITDWKRAEAEIRSLAKFPAENPNPVLRVARDGSILFANPASKLLLDDWGCQVGQRLPRERRDAILDAMQRGCVTELEVFCADRTYSILCAPIPDSQYVNVYGRDITERKQAEAALLRRTQQLEAVRAVGAEVTRELNLPVLLDLTIRRAVELMGAASGAVFLWDEAAQVLLPRAWCGLGDWLREVRLRLGEGFVGAVAQNRQGMIVNDYRGSAYAHPIFLERTAITACLAEPLLYRDRLVGVIGVINNADRPPFIEQDRETLGLLAAQSAIAIENARLHAETVRRGEELAALLRASRTVMSGLDLRETLDRIISEAAEIAGTPHIKVVLVDREAKVLRLAAAAGRPAQLFKGFTSPMDSGLSGIVATSGEPVFVADCQNDPRNLWADQDRALGIVTYLGLPIKSRGELVGVLTFNTDVPHQYRPDELAYLSSFADQAAIAIENARLFSGAQQRAAELSTLWEIGRAITGRLDLPAVLEAVAAGTIRLLDNPFAQLILWDEKTQRLQYGAALGPEAERVRHETFELGRGINGTVAQSRQPMILDDYQTSPYTIPEAPDVVATITVPILFGDRLLGVLHSHTTTPGRRFTPDDLRRLQMLAAQAAVAIEDARLYGETVRQLEDIRALYDVSRATASSLALDERLEAILVQLTRVMQTDRTLVALVDDPESDHCRLRLGYDRSKADPWLRHLNLSMLQYPEIRSAIQAQHPLIIPDVRNEPLLGSVRESLERVDLRSLLVLPLLARGRPIGAISLGYVGQGRTFTPEEIRFCQGIADMSATAIASAMLFEQVSRATAEWENTFNSIRDLVAIVDTEHRVVRVNRALAERLGATPDRLIGQRCHRALHGVDTPPPGCPQLDALATGETASREIEDAQLGGTYLVTCSPIQDAAGTILGSVHVARDITEQKRLEAESRQRQRFEDLSRAKSAFIATMSHELRTPLNSVIGFADLLLEQGAGPLTEKQTRFLHHIQQSGKHLLQLISDILDLSKIEAEKFQLHCEAIPVSGALEDIVVIARGLAHKKSQTIRADVSPDLPLLHADPVRFKQILFNLLGNAVKFTPESGTITVTARRVSGVRGQGPGSDAESPTPTTGEWLEVAVMDTGAGIRPEDLPRLFQEFTQLDTTQVRRQDGAGLGLALTKRLVEMHGGRIWAESEGQGKGSSFTVLLPFGDSGR